jgi:hypothetical protein
LEKTELQTTPCGLKVIYFQDMREETNNFQTAGAIARARKAIPSGRTYDGYEVGCEKKI